MSSLSAFTIERRDEKIHVSGELRLPDAAALWRALEVEIRQATSDRERKVEIDLSRAMAMDAMVVALVVGLRADLRARGIAVDIVGATVEKAELISLYGGFSAPAPRPEPVRSGLVETLGDEVQRVAHGMKTGLVILGDIVRGGFGALRRPSTGNWGSTFSLVSQAGTDAIPLVIALNGLVGFVMGYESSRQLERYGAEHFIADVVGVAVTRELSPVMTSIIVVGRSAAAYTAELGTMKVSDELDALRTMGLVPVRHLVLPRLLALSIVTPLLTLVGDVAGIAGGVAVSITRLDVGAAAFMTQLRSAIGPSDVMGGLIKASVAGFAIALIGVHRGLTTEGGPAGVGSRTTSTVVQSLVAIVIIDAFFAVFLKAIGT